MVKFYYFIGIAASNIIYSISHLLLLLGNNSTMCIIQNIFNQFGRISSIFWFFAIMFILSYSLKNPNLTQKDYIKHVPEIYFLIYGLSALTLIPFLTKYNNSPQKQIECITNYNYYIRQLFFFYLPLWITILFILYIYFKIRCIAKKGEILRIKYYAIILILSFTTPGITVLIDFIAYQCHIYKNKNDYEYHASISQSMLLQIINTICTSSFGLLHAATFAYTKEVRAQKLCKCICKCTKYFSITSKTSKKGKGTKVESQGTSTITRIWKSKNLPSDNRENDRNEDINNSKDKDNTLTEKSPCQVSERSINININLNVNLGNVNLNDSFGGMMETDIKDSKESRSSNDNEGNNTNNGNQTSTSNFLYNFSHFKSSVEQMIQIGIEKMGTQMTQSDESINVNCGCLNAFRKS